MKGRIHKIGLAAADVESAVRFYTEKLGLRLAERFPQEEGEDYVFLEGGGLVLELMPAGKLQAPPGFHHISLLSEDLDADAALLQERGVEMLKAPFAVGQAGVRLAIFQGPDGVQVQLFERRV